MELVDGGKLDGATFRFGHNLGRDNDDVAVEQWRAVRGRHSADDRAEIDACLNFGQARNSKDLQRHETDGITGP